MKRKTLTTAVLAGLTGMAGMVSVSNAVNLNPDGLGQVLLYPYYSTRGGNDTLISIVNTTDQAKSVKIRFIEGLNSREVLDFNIYMSAFDVWVAGIVTNTGGGGQMLTPDRTCTVPYFFQSSPITIGGTQFGRAPFVNYQYTGPNADGGPSSIARTGSGYIEVIEMGTLVGTAAGWATHVNGVPANCGGLVSRWQAGGEWTTNAGLDHEPPSGGLFGAGTVVNVGEGTMFTYNATALDAFAGPEQILHTNPVSINPNLTDGLNTESNVFINGFLDTQVWPAGPFAVNATLTLNQVMNEYVIGGDSDAASEWIITFPTKHFHVNTAPGGPQLGAPILPFTSTWSVPSPFACEEINFRFWDREEREPAPGDVIPSPPPPTPDSFELCIEANVIRFGSGEETPPGTSEIFKEPFGFPHGYVNFDLPDDFGAGWVRFDFNPQADAGIYDHPSIPSAQGIRYLGLPLIGFWANTHANGVADGGMVLRNYAGAYQHRGSRRIVLSD